MLLRAYIFLNFYNTASDFCFMLMMTFLIYKLYVRWGYSYKWGYIKKVIWKIQVGSKKHIWNMSLLGSVFLKRLFILLGILTKSCQPMIFSYVNPIYKVKMIWLLLQRLFRDNYSCNWRLTFSCIVILLNQESFRVWCDEEIYIV